MTHEEEIQEGLKWEAELNRRLRYHRNTAIKNAIRESRIEITILFAILVGFFVVMYFWNKYQPLRERAAYLEGRWGLDHATAMTMAEKRCGDEGVWICSPASESNQRSQRGARDLDQG